MAASPLSSREWNSFDKLSKQSDVFTYENGKKSILIEVVNRCKSRDEEVICLHLLGQVYRFPDQLYCGARSDPDDPDCCYAHIVECLPCDKWRAACDKLEHSVKMRLSKKQKTDMSPEEVLRRLTEQDTANEYAETTEWLSKVLPEAYAASQAGRVVVGDDLDLLHVSEVAKVYTEVYGRRLRPVQLASILLNVRSTRADSSILVEMKTGEGKTDVCAAIASVVARRNPDAAVHIVTSSSDRAADDRKSTMRFIQAATGKAPALASEGGLQWGPEGCGVAYAQVTDVLKMMVDALQEGVQHRDLFAWLGGCFLMVDEADHVLIEQAENQLYISSPCRGFQALVPIQFLCLAFMDFHKDFTADQVKDVTAVSGKAGPLAEELNQAIRKFAGEAIGNRWWHIAPAKVDEVACCGRIASGSLIARFKQEGKEFIVDAQEEHGLRVPQVVIVDMATGTESVGTRWTAEAPAVEAFCGLPVGGSDPLAFFSSIPRLAEKYACICGITGTLGQEPCLDYYAKVYNCRNVFRIPRNLPSCIYQLEPVFSRSEGEWLGNIRSAAESYISTGCGLGVTGPVLIVVECITKAKQVVEHLVAAGHAEMVQADDDWVPKRQPMPVQDRAHVFPYYLGTHGIMHELPDAAIVVATNKGGRGLDLKLDGRCPSDCNVQHPCNLEICEGGRVLFVILTDVLSERQDVQARGRCGRSGKAGVIRYQLLDDREDTSHAASAEGLSRLLEMQAAKGSNDASELAMKTGRVAQMKSDAFLLETIVDWKANFKRDWLSKLFPHGSTVPQQQTLQKAVAKWLEAFVVERWAYWRTMAPPVRREGDTKHHFFSKMALDPELSDLEEKAGTTLQDFLQRFLNFACWMRLDAEQLFALALELLKLSESDRDFKCAANNLLEKATREQGPGWTLPQDELWQPEWTGNAALVLAAVRQELYPSDVNEALRRCQERLRHLIKVLRLEQDDKAPSRVDALAYKARQAEQAPGGSTSSVGHDGVDAPQQTARYRLQYKEMLRQLAHRKGQIELAMRGERPWRLEHLPAALEKSKEPKALAWHLHSMGYSWAKTVFEFYLDGEGLCILDEGRDEELNGWIEDQMKKVEEVSSSRSGELHGRGAGGGGGDVEMNTETTDGAWVSSGQKVIAALHAGAHQQHHDQQQHAYADTKVSDVFRGMQPAARYVRTGRHDSPLRTWILDKWYRFISWVNAQGILYRGREASSQSQDLRARVAAAFAGRLAAPGGTRTTLSDAAVEAAMGEDVEEHVGSVTHELIQLVYSMENVLMVSSLDAEGADTTIHHDGTSATPISRSQAKEEAEKESKNELYVVAEGMSEADEYLAHAFLKAFATQTEQGKHKTLAQTFSQLQTALHTVQARAAALKAQGLSANQREIAKINAVYRSLLERAKNVALAHGDRGARVLGNEYKIAFENYKAVTQPSLLAKAVTGLKSVATTVKDTVTSVVSKMWSSAQSAADWLWERTPNSVRTVTRTVVSQVVVVVQSAAEVARDIAAAAASRISAAYTSVQTRVSSAWGRAAHEAGALWRWAEPLISERAASALAGMVWISGSIQSACWRVAKWVWGRVPEVAKSLIRTVAGEASAFFQRATELAYNVASDIAIAAYTFARQYAAWVCACTTRMAMVAWQWADRATFGLLSGALAVLSWLWEATGGALLVRWRARADIERFRQWGNMEAFEGHSPSFLLIDLERHSGGVSEQQLRRRAALQTVAQTGFINWFLDPSVRLNLDTNLPESAQLRQDRAHAQYLRQRQEDQERWSTVLGVVGLAISIISLVASTVGAVFTGGATAIAAVLTVKFLVEILGAAMIALQLITQCMLRHIAEDTTLTQEQRQDAQHRLRRWQTGLTLAGIALMPFEAMLITSGGLYRAAGLAMAASQLTILFARFSRTFQAVRSYASMALRALKMPAQLRSVGQTLDRVLGTFGINGAALYQLGLTSGAKIWDFFLEHLAAFASACLAFFHLLLRAMTAHTASRNAQEETASAVTSYLDTECEVAQSQGGATLMKTEVKARVEGRKGEKGNKGPPTKASSSTDRVVYTYRGSEDGKPVDLEYDTTAKKLVTSRPLTDDEKVMFEGVDSAASLNERYQKFTSQEGTEVRTSDKDSMQSFTDEDGGSHTSREIKIDNVVFTIDGNSVKVREAGTDREVTLTREQCLRILSRFGVDLQDVVFDEDGVPSLKEWATDPSSAPRELPGTQASRQVNRLIQVIAFLQTKKQGGDLAEAKKAAEDGPVRRLAWQVSDSSEEAKTLAMLMKELGFQIDKDFVVKNGIVQPLGLEKPLKGAADTLSSLMRTVAYLEARSPQSGMSEAQARDRAESPEAVKDIYNRLANRGFVDRSRVQEAAAQSEPFEPDTDKFVRKVEKRLGDAGKDFKHKMSMEDLSKRVNAAVQANDRDELARITSALLDSGDNPQYLQGQDGLMQDYGNLRKEQQQSIYDQMLRTVRFASNGHLSDQQVQKEVSTLLRKMNSYIGNLEPASNANQAGDAAASEAAKHIKAERMRQNRKNGKAWEKRVAKEDDVIQVQLQPLDDTGKPMVDQDGNRVVTIMDLLRPAKGGRYRLLECKNGPDAPLTKNQRIAFPAIEKNGFIVLSNNGGLVKGSRHPPTPVEIIRPGNGEVWRPEQ